MLLSLSVCPAHTGIRVKDSLHFRLGSFQLLSLTVLWCLSAVTVSEPPNPVALQKEPSEEELPTHEDELVVLVLGCKAKRI